MSNILSIALAGVAGVLLRYFLSTWLDQHLSQRWSSAFPWGTVAVNLSGCFAAGCVFQLLFERAVSGEASRFASIDSQLRNALMVGFLGGFTTFSAYSIQTLTMLSNSQWLAAALNVGISNVGGIALAWAGFSLARAL